MPTTADFTSSKLRSDSLRSSGVQPRTHKMLGATGFAGTGKGAFMDCVGVTKKTFMLYPENQAGADITTGVVEIHGAMVEDAADAVANTKFIVIGTLDAATRRIMIEDPWPLIRCVVTASDPVNMQVGLHGLVL